MFNEILKSINHNEHYLNRYIKFINHFKDIKFIKGMVKHHICPAADDMFPEYSNFNKFKWNRINLTHRQHYIAHMLLWKAYRNKSMTYAANMMSNFQGLKYSSKLYQKLREEFALLTSINNSGLPQSAEAKRKNSELMKGSLVVKDIRFPENGFFRIWFNDPAYNPEYHISSSVGKIKSEESKQKVSEKNKNRKHIYNIYTKERKFISKNDELPEDFAYGYCPEIKSLYGTSARNTIWVYNENTNEQIRLKNNEPIPESFIKGRNPNYNNKGFEIANTMINVTDLLNKKITKVFEINYNIHAPFSGLKTENTKIYIFDNKIFTSVNSLMKYCESVNIFILERNKFDISNIIVYNKRIRNILKKQFSLINNGKTYKDLGFLQFNLCDFCYENYNHLEIFW